MSIPFLAALRTASVPAAALMAALLFPSCSSEPAFEGTPGVQRIRLAADIEAESKPAAVVAGELRPKEGMDTWTITSPEWIFEGAGTRERSLRLEGQGDKAVLIPGPLNFATYDRVRVEIANPASGKLRATFRMADGHEIKGEARVPKSRSSHKVTLALPRAVTPDEAVESLTLELDIKRGSTLFGIELLRQPLLDSLPSAETGPRLIEIGETSRRAVAVGPGSSMAATVTAEAGHSVVLWVAGVPEKEASLTGGVVSVAVTPAGGGEAKSATITIKPEWQRVIIEDLVAGTHELRADYASPMEGAVCAISEPQFVHTAPTAAEGKIPSVLLATSSFHRADVLQGVPELQALTASGVTFTSAFASSSTTIPSYVALQTGIHPRDNKVLGGGAKLGRDTLSSPGTLAEAFAARGYRTLAVLGSGILADSVSGLGRGFDTVVRPAGGRAGQEDTLLHLRREMAGQGPIFVWLELQDARVVAGADGAIDREEYMRGVALAAEGLKSAMALPRFTAGLVAFTSDHGESFQRGEEAGTDVRLTPDTLQVPLVLRLPGGARAGESIDRMVQQKDLGRTILSAVGFTGVAFPGADLLAPEPEPLAMHFALSHRAASVTDGRWHAVLTLVDGGARGDEAAPVRHQLQLFDVTSDPRCARDVAQDQAGVAGKLHGALAEWLQSADPAMRSERSFLDARTRADMAELGYGNRAAAAPLILFESDCDCSPCILYR